MAHRILAIFRRPYLPAALFYAGVAVSTSFFPLIRDVHYEFAALTALLASIVSGFVALRRMRGGMWGGRTILNIVGIAFVPLGVGLLRSLVVHSCGLWEGILWYLVLAPASAWCGIVVARLAATLVHRVSVQYLLFIGLWLASMVRGAWEAYTGPHMFLYIWQVGFFPGGSWDAELPITERLLFYRAAQLAISVALYVMLREIERYRIAGTFRPHIPRTAVAAVLALGVAIALPYRPELGITRTDMWLQSELGDSLCTPHAVIYYRAATTDSLDLWRAATRTEFYIAEEAAALEILLDSVEPVTIYLYATPAEQKQLVGTSSASFTKPWRRLVNQTFARIPATLKHELAHVMFAPYGQVIGISTSQGLLEGSAMALENDYLWRTLDEYARMMYAFDMAPPPAEIMGAGGFSSQRSSVSYVLAGSFSRWLIASYGIERFKLFYTTGDATACYGVSITELSNAYQRSIDSLPSPDSTYNMSAKYLFGGGSFFALQCLRRIGTLNTEGYNALEQQNYTDALRTFGESLEHGSTYGTRAGILYALAGAGNYRALLDSAITYSRDSAGYQLLPLLIEQGDAHWALGDTARARNAYDSVITMDISRGLSTRAALRLFFLNLNGPLADTMRRYITTPMQQRERVSFLKRVIETMEPCAEQPNSDRVVLELMLATLQTSASPQQSLVIPMLSLEEIASRYLYNVRQPFPDTLNKQTSVRHFLVSSLMEQLLDAYLLSIASQAHAAPVNDARAHVLLDYIYLDGPQALSPRSRNYRNERRAEAGRYLRFLHDASALR